MTWSHAKVTQYLSLQLAPDRQSYRPRQPVRLTIKISNRGREVFSIPPELMNRSARILFMEREGRGFFLISLKTLFPRRRRLIIGPGRSIQARFVLRPEDLAERTAVLHYELPEQVRTFQIFLPLAEEEPDGFRNMLGYNTEGVTVSDSWANSK